MRRLPPDVVVVDLFIPPSDGFEICRFIKQVAPETLVIIMSASSDSELARGALDAGASAFVNKVAAGNDLVPAIQQAMARRSISVPNAAIEP